MSQVLLVQSEARAIPLADESVHCIVTSPPYWGLRDYGIGVDQGELGSERLHDCLAWARQEAPCGECYVCHMREVMAECWRVLREDGTLWLNLGDTYNNNPSWGRGQSTLQGRPQDQIPRNPTEGWLQHARTSVLKPKNLCGLPWRVALALQADGWVLRSEIIWHVPNKMPESVQDRPTRAHEQVFLFAKRPRYFFDAYAVREPYSASGLNDAAHAYGYGTKGEGKMQRLIADGVHGSGGLNDPTVTRDTFYQHGGRNVRTVWSIPTQGYPGEHFATFPQRLAEWCILGGTSAYGCCVQCGAPWARVVERQRLLDGHIPISGSFSRADEPHRIAANGKGQWRYSTQTTEYGWAPGCGCDAPRRPCLVLDPFVGSGTVPLVARELGRHGVGLDLSWPYLHDVARKRLGLDKLAAWEGRASSPPEEAWDTLPLFRARR